jgi:hypothetical protein
MRATAGARIFEVIDTIHKDVHEKLAEHMKLAIQKRLFVRLLDPIPCVY